MTTVTVEEPPSYDAAAGEETATRLRRAATAGEELARLAGTGTTLDWWGPAKDRYDVDRVRGQGRADAVASASNRLADAVKTYSAATGLAVSSWRSAIDDLVAARHAAAVVVGAGDVLDPRPAGHAEDEARRRIERARADLDDAARHLTTAAYAALEHLDPPPPPTPFEVAVVATSPWTGLEVDDGYVPATGQVQLGPVADDRAALRGVVEAAVDAFRSPYDLGLMMLNRQLTLAGAPRMPAVRFAFEDDLRRRLDEFTGPCSWDTNPSCAANSLAGYASFTLGTAAIPTGGTEAAAVRTGEVAAAKSGRIADVTVVGTKFSESEQKMAEAVADLGYTVTLREQFKGPNVSRRTDLLVNGIPYDVYTPETGSIANIVRGTAAKRKQVDGGGVVVDLSHTSVTSAELGDLDRRVRSNTSRICEVIVIDGELS